METLTLQMDPIDRRTANIRKDVLLFDERRHGVMRAI